MIKLNLSESIFSPKLYPLLLDYSHRFEFYKGSAGSGKSYFITQKLIIRACRERIKVLVCRKYGTTIRNTCFALFKQVIEEWKLTPYVKIRESDFNIRFPNGSEFIFSGLDEETKLLSLTNIGCVFIEEVFEVSRDMVEQLDLRLRGNTQNQQILASFNPISKSHWLYDFCEVNPPESFYFSQTTYKDNPFLSAEYINALRDIEKRNPAKARIYCFGEWGVEDEGLVIKNWCIENFDAMQLASIGYEHRAGMDLGFIDKSAIIDTLYNREDHIIYVFNEFYKSGCQLTELSEALKDMNLTKTKVFVDSAEPRSIQFFKQQGIPATPCAKGKDSIRSGLDFLKDNKIIVHPKCVNFINELENFSYIKSKITGEYTNDTTHEFSHAIDACRYAYSDIYTQTKLKTINKNSLGI